MPDVNISVLAQVSHISLQSYKKKQPTLIQMSLSKEGLCLTHFPPSKTAPRTGSPPKANPKGKSLLSWVP